MDAIIEGFSLLLKVENIILISLGVLIGVLVGALPGLSSPMAIALLTPFTLQQAWQLLELALAAA